MRHQAVAKTNSILRALAALCLLFALCDFSAQAQFSGPAFSSSAEVNRPISLTTDPAILYPQQRELRLLPGDTIAVHLYGSLDYTPILRVSVDGSIEVPLVGKLQVENLTTSQAEKLIADRLIAAGMYRNPQVTIQVTDAPNHIVTFAGEVHAVIPIVGQKRLLDVLGAAAGLTPLSSHILTIHRPGVDEPIVVDLGNNPMKSQNANIPVFAGDTIVVARMGSIYMLGAFKNVGAIPLQQNTPLTLLQATSIAGGAGFQGKLGELRLIRTIGLERKVVKLDMKRIQDGKDPDPVLQTDDIVLLPSNLLKSAIKSGGLSTVVGFASILAIASQ
jgi:polysaccharide export outer membrane protein